MTVRNTPTRLATAPVEPARRNLAAATTVAFITAAASAGLWSVPIAMLAAGAGAGYSLSGSV